MPLLLHDAYSALTIRYHAQSIHSHFRQRIDKFAKGIYAIQITGKLPVEVQEQLMDKGIGYRARDGTVID